MLNFRIGRKLREKRKKQALKNEKPAITLEMVMRENPGISIPDAFQKLAFLRAQEEAKATGAPLPADPSLAASTAAMSASTPATTVAGGVATAAPATAALGQPQVFDRRWKCIYIYKNIHTLWDGGETER